MHFLYVQAAACSKRPPPPSPPPTHSHKTFTRMLPTESGRMKDAKEGNKDNFTLERRKKKKRRKAIEKCEPCILSRTHFPSPSDNPKIYNEFYYAWGRRRFQSAWKRDDGLIVPSLLLFLDPPLLPPWCQSRGRGIIGRGGREWVP